MSPDLHDHDEEPSKRADVRSPETMADRQIYCARMLYYHDHISEAAYIAARKKIKKAYGLTGSHP